MDSSDLLPVNVAIWFGCLLAGRGYHVDWKSVAEAALICEKPVEPPKEEPDDPKAAG